jgi:hypothetical protein
MRGGYDLLRIWIQFGLGMDMAGRILYIKITPYNLYSIAPCSGLMS